MAVLKDPSVVGKMVCGACGDIMEVRQKKVGKKLLYTCCPNCKTDQRTGAKIQAFWRENMVSPEQDIAVTPPKANSQPTETKTELAEWEPEVLPPETENSKDKTETSTISTSVTIGVAVVLCFFGIHKAMRA